MPNKRQVLFFNQTFEILKHWNHDSFQIPPEMVSAILESLSQGINVNPSKLAFPGSLATSFVNGQAIIIMRQRRSRRTSDVYRDRAFRAIMGLTTKDKDEESCSSSSDDQFPSQVLSVQEVFRSHFMRRRASSIWFCYVFDLLCKYKFMHDENVISTF